MAFTTPRTWTDGELVTASMLNANVRDNVRFLKGLDGVPYIENAIELPEQATPATPASGRGRLFFDTSGVAKAVNDGGSIAQMLAHTPTTAWTPVLAGSSTAGTFTYARQVGRYSQVGPVLFYSGVITISAISVAPTGVMRITGLPVVAVTVTDLEFPTTFGYVSNVSMSNTASVLTGAVGSGASVISLYEARENTAGPALAAADFDDNAGAYLIFSGWYLTT